MNKHICISGDSIFRGVVLNDAGHYTISDAIGWKSLADTFSLSIDNRSRFGFTVTKGFAYLKRQFEQNAETHAHPYDAVLLEYGGNDSDYDWHAVSEAPDEEHLPHTPLGLFRTTYHSMIDFLKTQNVRPILTTLPPVRSDRYLAWISRDGLSKDAILHWLGDENAIYRHQEMYSLAVCDIAEETGCPLVDLRGAFLQTRHMGALLCEDGIHPSVEGQRLIASVLRNAVADNLTAAG